MWIADTARCREIDRRATEEFGIPAMVLMERAGLAVFETLRQMLPEGGRIIVLCGPGNNGGDGFVVARLAHEHGYGVTCLVTSDEASLREECRQQMLQARGLGLRPVFAGDPRWERKLECLGSFDLIVDAILGIGAHGPLLGNVAEAVRAVNRSGVPVLAIDVPSGIETDTGAELGDSVWALRTVTFGLPKPYLFQAMGLEHSGYWTVADIGFPRQVANEPTGTRMVCQDWVASLVPERLRSSHKGMNGHVLIVAGSRGMRGAAALAAKAAYRSGAGVVTVASVEPVLETVMAHCPECVLMPLPETDGVIDPAAFKRVIENQHHFDAALFGPGMSQTQPVKDFLAKVWCRWEVPSCIDADALNAIASGLTLPPCECVLTPHPGEMGRLLGKSADQIQADRLGCVAEAAQRLGKTVLLKGAHSLATGPGQDLLVNQTGNPGMASAGMGDVLGGVVTTLLGQDAGALEAAAAGMFWHGLAGDLAAMELGAVGYTARDVISRLPAARAKLTLTCKEDRSACSSSCS
ncbi:MAG: NAD(P)H-hydrate dehydratase [Fimbriimonadaceae bacterium]|nr:NAD(P)H-hydrate dehydratase [Fimbriimonadaceae bacterium]QYK56918.1 MAG: NAD(P)H-hydrate dehydratase [Fimbriimonadaceae bacterium]